MEPNLYRNELVGLGSSVAARSVTINAIICVLLIVVLCSHLIYNVFLHPLRNYPGPTLWSVTRLPWCLWQARGRLNNRLLELHKEYGHVVRIAPNELSYTTDTAWKTIYGNRSIEMGKDPVFRLHTPTGTQNILVADRETHTRQRRLLSHAFSEKALREQESIIMMYVNKLLDQLSTRSASGPLNMVAWYNFTTFDLIGDLSFGENFGCLDSGDYVPFVRAIEQISKELTFMQMFIYYRLQKIRQYFMPKAIAGARFQNVKRAMDTVDRRINRETDRKDFLHYILAANDKKGMSRAEINVNAFSLSIAGSESAATCLCGATYFLLTHPQNYATLVTEVREAFASELDITLASTVNLEYLEAVISESLRLYPPVAGTLPRQVPHGGETIDGTYVPAGVSVGVNHFSTYHHPQNFYRAEDFLPERWLPGIRDAAPFDKDNRACMQAFSFGPRNCLGKNLARAEMRLILTMLLWRFDLELVEGRGDWIEGQQIWGFWNKPPLMCRLKAVERE